MTNHANIPQYFRIESIATSQPLPNFGSSLFPTCSQPDPSLSPACSRPVPNLFPTCSQPDPSLSPACSQPVPNLFPTCSHPVPSLIPAYPQPADLFQLVPNLFPACSLLVPDLFPTCSLLVPYLFPTNFAQYHSNHLLPFIVHFQRNKLHQLTLSVWISSMPYTRKTRVTVLSSDEALKKLIRGRLDIDCRAGIKPHEEARARDAFRLLAYPSTPIVSKSTARQESYRHFLSRVEKNNGSQAVLLCAVSLGRCAVAGMRDHTRLYLPNKIKEHEAGLRSPFLQSLADIYRADGR